MELDMTAAITVMHDHLIDVHGWDDDNEEEGIDRSGWTLHDWVEAHEADHDEDVESYLEHDRWVVGVR